MTGRGAHGHQQIGTLANLRCNGAIGNVEPLPLFPNPSLVDGVPRVDRVACRVVAVDKLMDETIGAALMICDYGQIATMAAKESINRAFESGLSDGIMFERRLFHALFATQDQKEGMDAFVNKRKANFVNA